MTNFYPQHRNCFVEGCDNPPSGRIPTLSLCGTHGLEVAMVFREDVLSIARREYHQAHQGRVEKYAKKRGDREGSLVYYVRIGGYIKIGYSTRLRQRFSLLRADELLAVEPGGPELERQRHEEFSAERIDRRRENFRPSDRLIEHIGDTKDRYGLPYWSTVPRTSIVRTRQIAPKSQLPKDAA